MSRSGNTFGSSSFSGDAADSVPQIQVQPAEEAPAAEGGGDACEAVEQEAKVEKKKPERFMIPRSLFRKRDAAVTVKTLRYVWQNNVPIASIGGEPFSGRTVLLSQQRFYDESQPWVTDLYAAKTRTLKENVPILLHDMTYIRGEGEVTCAESDEPPFNELRHRVLGPTVASTIANAFAAYSERPFLGREITDETGTRFEYLSYREVGARIEHLSERLSERCAPGQFIAMTGPNCVDYVVLLLACMRRRFVPVPLNTHFDGAAVAAVLEELATSGAGLGAVFAAKSIQSQQAVEECAAGLAGAREKGHLGDRTPLVVFDDTPLPAGAETLADFEQAVPTERKIVAPACTRGHSMRTSFYARGGHQHGWVCDRCGALRRPVPEELERWFCLRCKEDVCFNCVPRTYFRILKQPHLQPDGGKRPGCGLLPASVYVGEWGSTRQLLLMLRVVYREHMVLHCRLWYGIQSVADVRVRLGSAQSIITETVDKCTRVKLDGAVGLDGAYEGSIVVDGEEGTFHMLPLSDKRVESERRWEGWRCPEGHSLIGLGSRGKRRCNACGCPIQEGDDTLVCPEERCSEAGYSLCEPCVLRGHCCGGHPLVPYTTTPLLAITCDQCDRLLMTGAEAATCVRCDYDVCGRCAASASEQQDALRSAVESRRALQAQRYAVGQRSPAIIILYTSGSTGMPKGAIVDETSMRRELHDCLGTEGGEPRKSEWSSVHLLDTYMAVSSTPYTLLTTCLLGCRIAVYERHHKTFEVTKIVAPTSVCLVPEMWRVLYKEYQSRKEAGEDEAELQHHYQHCLGHRVRSINCGGAKPHPEVMAWLKKTYPQCSVTENYASTEAGPITYGQTSDGFGQILENVQYKLEDHGQYTSADKPHARGELLVLTEGLFQGYLKRADKTAEAFDSEGFYRTGDIVEFREDEKGGRPWIRIIDRMKSLFKMSNGEWVSPEDVEQAYLTSPLVEQVFVHGDSSHSTLCAIVVPRPAAAEAGDPLAVVTAALEDAGQQRQLRRSLRVATVALADGPFTSGNGQLTQTAKLCRPGLRRAYEETLRRLLDKGEAIEEDRAGRLSGGLVDLLSLLADADAPPPTDAQFEEFSAFPWSSAFVSAVRHVLSKRFSVEISYDLLPDNGALATDPRWLTRLQNVVRSGEAAEAPIVWEQEAVLPAEIKPADGAAGKDVLLTGVTGFMGPAVLHHMLESMPEATFYCLHRGPADRVVDSMRRHRGWDESRDAARVKPVSGDLESPWLGLSEEDRDAVCERCGVVVHAAAFVQHLMGYRRLKPANVGSVVESLRICGEKTPKRLVYVSTISVLDGVRGPQTEDRIATAQEIAATGSGYAQSKWVGEALVREAARRGFDCQIWRPGLMTPDVVTGAANLQDWMMRFVRCCILVGRYCAGDRPFSVSPVNHAAMAVVRAMALPPAPGVADTFHTPTAATSARAFLRMVSEATADKGVILREVAEREWGMLMEDIATNNPLFSFREQFRGGMDGLGGTEATATVQRLGLPAVPIYTQESVDAMVDWLSFHDEDLGIGSFALLDRCGMSTHSNFEP